jgi:hypothetical protein
MALTCTAESLAQIAKCYCCSGISEKQLLAASIYLTCQFLNGQSVTCTPENIVQLATAAGFLKLSEKQMIGISTYLDCQITNNGGGGGGGTTQVFAGNYGGGQPNFTPTTSTAIAIDTSNDTQWNYYSGAWH